MKTKKLIWLYVLKSVEGEYYVGKAVNLPRRVKEHQIGRGSKVTKGWKSFIVFRQVQIPFLSEADSRRLERMFALSTAAAVWPAQCYGPGLRSIDIATKKAERKKEEDRKKTGCRAIGSSYKGYDSDLDI